MVDETARILPLPAEVAAQIKSSATISTLVRAVYGLVENALDAGACKIDINVDFRRGACTVEDDGLGIAPADFSDGGGLGKPYHTSKNNSSRVVHGRNGVFLSSLAALSILTITSHHHAHRLHATLILHHSRPAARLVPAPMLHELLNREHGTKISVQDLFGNMPVRVKQRAAMGSNDSRGNDKEWDLLKKHILGLLLAWDTQIGVTVRSAGSARTLTVRGKELFTDQMIQQPFPRPFNLALTTSVLSQAAYIEPSEWGNWIKTSARTPLMTIQGAISLQPAPSKQVQFIALGVHYIDSEAVGNVLYDEINRLFASSSFGKQEDISAVGRWEKDITNKRRKQSGYTNKQFKGTGKGVDRWPMFFIRIDLQDDKNSIDMGSHDPLNRDSTVSSLLKVLGALVTEFLGDHYFKPRTKHHKKRPKLLKETSASPSQLCSISSSEKEPFPASWPLSSRTRKGSTIPLVPPEQNSRVDQLPSGLERNASMQGTTGPPGVSPDIFDSNVKLPSFTRNKERLLATDFSGWSRIKSGKRGCIDDELCGHKGGSRDEIQTSRLVPGGVIMVDMSCHDEAENHSPRYNTEPKDIYGCSSGLVLPLLDDYRSNETTVAGGDNPLAKTLQEDIVTPEAEFITWINPISKATILISSRTGLAVAQSSKRLLLASALSSPPSASSNQSFTPESRGRLTRSSSGPPKTPSSGSWVGTFLRDWNNPVFHLTEESITQVSFDGPNIEASDILHGRHRRCSHADIEKALTESSSAYSTKLSRKHLSDAKVIAQVDQKFVLVRMRMNSLATYKHNSSSSDGELLVLIDQHAADERIRVEALLSDLCSKPVSETSMIRSNLNMVTSVATVLLTKPLKFQLQDAEHRLFTSHAQHFADWGILYDLSTLQLDPTVAESTACTLTVKTLPGAIAERCRIDVKLLIELMRGEAWKREDLGLRTRTKTTTLNHNPELSSAPYPETTFIDSPTAPSWLSQIGSCPQAILDMLNSRSCRSAIMFNDSLTTEDCKALVRKLAKCMFPFQCAHGRPSMIPLIQLGQGEDGFGTRVGNRSVDARKIRGFGEMWRKWKDNSARDDAKEGQEKEKEQ